MRLFSTRLWMILLFFGLYLPGTMLWADAGTEATDEPIEALRLSLVTWNIEWYPGRFRYARRPRQEEHAAVVKQELARINPDIFLAQEMRGWEAFAGLCSVVDGLNPVVVSAFRSRSTGQYWPQQIAIASKLPVFAAWSENWHRDANDVDPGRGFSVAAIRLPDPFRLLLVYSVHLKSNLADTESQTRWNYILRESSTRQLIDHIREMEEVVFPGLVAGVVVGGDFNTNQDDQFGDRVVEMMLEAGFHKAWEGVPREERLTWRGSEHYEPTTLDHFFTRGLGMPTAKMLEVSDDTSDHWPVKIQLEIPLPE